MRRNTRHGLSHPGSKKEEVSRAPARRSEYCHSPLFPSPPLSSPPLSAIPSAVPSSLLSPPASALLPQRHWRAPRLRLCPPPPPQARCGRLCLIRRRARFTTEAPAAAMTAVAVVFVVVVRGVELVRCARAALCLFVYAGRRTLTWLPGRAAGSHSNAGRREGARVAVRGE